MRHPLRHRCMNLRSRHAAALMMCVALMLASCGGLVSSGSASCAATLDFDGRTYSGYGDVRVVPPESQTLGEGTMPLCDDDYEDVSRETVRVRALAGSDPAEAVVVGQEEIFIADDLEQFPERIRVYFDQVECSTDGPFSIEGQWTAVVSPRASASESRPLEPRSPRVNLKPPYEITVLVHDGLDGGNKYRRSYVDNKVTRATKPYLDREDMKVALWDVLHATTSGLGDAPNAISKVPALMAVTMLAVVVAAAPQRRRRIRAFVTVRTSLAHVHNGTDDVHFYMVCRVPDRSDYAES